ncbi:MAG: GWxTD domain-containing protein [Acidobacteriota bacterium]
MKKLISILAGVAFAACALAELSKYKDWDKSPEAYFLTPAERAEWKKVASDEDAEKFIALYWAKRDPSPGTAQNEFRDEVGRKIAAADQQFKMPRYKRGADSIRGRLLIVLGTPSRAAQQALGPQEAPSVQEEGGFQPGPAGGGGGGDESEQSISLWTYDKEKLSPFGLSELRARILLDQRRGVDSLQNSGEVEKALAAVAEKSIVNPNPTAVASAGPTAASEAPKAASAAPVAPALPAGAGKGPAAAPAAAAPAAPAPAAGAPAASLQAIPLPAAVKTALQAADGKGPSDAAFWSGTFRSASGDPFLALQFYLPSDKPALAAPELKFGGVVTNEGGQEVGSFWETATLSEVAEGTRKDHVFDRSIPLPAGSYKGSFGLFAAEGQPPLASARVSFHLAGKSGEFEISPLLLSNGIIPLTKRPGPADPFVFGTDKPMKVEPKGDRRFSKQDSLWYFYAVINPAVPAAAAEPAGTPAAAAPKPRIMTRINVQLDGRDAFAPFTGPADLQPVGEGAYAAGSEIPLASFEPGYYSFLVKVRDLNAAPGSVGNKGIDRREDFVVLMPDGSLPQKKAAAAAPKPKKP